MLIADEMKIKEDLVYDKTGRHVLGFVNLGNINDQLQELESQASALTDKPTTDLATHMLTIMVRGIFFKLEFPYASFPTQGIVAISQNTNNVVHVYRCYRRDDVLDYVGSSATIAAMWPQGAYYNNTESIALFILLGNCLCL